MKKRMICTLLSIFLLLTLLPTTVFAGNDLITVQVAGTRNYAACHEILQLTNQERSAEGLGSLTLNATLTELAMQRAAEAALAFHHTRPDGTPYHTVLDGVYMNYTSRGENLRAEYTEARNFGGSDEAIQGWMNSPDHKAAILNGSFTQMGVGCFVTGHTIIWVQLFGNSSTDTAPLTRSDTVNSIVPVRIPASELKNLSPNLFVEAVESGTSHFDLCYSTQLGAGCDANLVPSVSEILDSNGNLIATLSFGGKYGMIQVDAVAPGSAAVSLPVYPGEQNPAQLNLTVFSTYNIEILPGGNGTAAASESSATKYSLVDVLATPNAGYYASGACYIAPDGTRVPLTPRGENEFQFSMPAHNVKIEVEYTAFTEDHPKHSEVTYNAAEPTCSTNGRTGETYCTVCGLLLRRNQNLPALSHSFGPEVLSDDQQTITQTCVLCGEIQTTYLINVFKDISPDKFYYVPALWAYYKSITSGTAEYTFSPENTCTRAQVVTFLWRAQGAPEPETANNPFTDINEADYFYKAVLWAVENGITQGTGNGKYSPNDPCTRAQVATFLWRTLGEPQPCDSSNPFSDVLKGYYYDAVLWAVEENITQGVGNGLFAPDNPCTRGQIVTFLYRCMTDH